LGLADRFVNVGGLGRIPQQRGALGAVPDSPQNGGMFGRWFRRAARTSCRSALLRRTIHRVIAWPSALST